MQIHLLENPTPNSRNPKQIFVKGADGQSYSYWADLWNQGWRQGDTVECKVEQKAAKNGKIYNNIMEGYIVPSNGAQQPVQGWSPPVQRTPQIPGPATKSTPPNASMIFDRVMELITKVEAANSKLDRLISTFMDSGVNHSSHNEEDQLS